MKLFRYRGGQLVFNLSTFILFFIVASISGLSVHANPFAKNIPNSAPNACPADHKMYYIGKSPPAYSLKETRGLVWTTGNQEQDRFTFSERNVGDKVFFMKFTGVETNSTRYGKKSPYFGNISSVSSDAINFVHNSPAAITTNNTVSLSSNWPISKIGFKIQDLDSYGTGNSLAYIEQARALNNGKLSLAYTPPASPFHILSQNNSIVTAIAGRNCSLDDCTIDATWSYTPANTEIVLEHGITQTKSDSVHAVGYSDFYYCLAPPRIVLQKSLNGDRISSNDQFELKITGSSTTPTNNFITAGTESNVSNNTASKAVTLSLNNTYSIEESIVGGGSIKDYDATYSCTNSTTLSLTNLSNAKGNMDLNSSGDTRSFTIANLNYGDEITCTITNTPSAYTFTGHVFNDNGGLTLEANKVGVVNSAYFNGKFDSTSGEIGVSDSNLTISLTDCSEGNTAITNTSPQLVPSTGKYVFNVPRSSLQLGQTVCLVENEPVEWEYSVDTTTNKRKVIIAPDRYGYDNLDFGEVTANNTALVLIKSQYIHDCNDLRTFIDMPQNPQPDLPTNGFSTEDISGIVPGQCIAYKIEAHNRSHLNLESIQIKDKLQTNPVKSVFHLPFPVSIPSGINNNNNILPNSEIISNQFNLQAAPPSGSATIATLYFNTKYGTTVDP